MTKNGQKTSVMIFFGDYIFFNMNKFLCKEKNPMTNNCDENNRQLREIGQLS